MCPARRPFWSIAVLIVAVLLTAVLGAAAAAQVATLGSPAPQASTAPTSPVPDGQDGLLAWAACMRDHGVEMDDPQFDLDGQVVSGLGKSGTGSTSDVKGEAYQLASEACSDLIVAFKAPPDAQQQAEQANALLTWAACMRDQGVDVPDPNADGTFADYDWKLDLKGTDFVAANTVCGEAAGAKSGT